MKRVMTVLLVMIIVMFQTLPAFANSVKCYDVSASAEEIDKRNVMVTWEYRVVNYSNDDESITCSIYFMTKENGEVLARDSSSIRFAPQEEKWVSGTLKMSKKTWNRTYWLLSHAVAAKRY